MVRARMFHVIEAICKPGAPLDPFTLHDFLDVIIQLEHENRAEVQRYLAENDMSVIFEPLNRLSRGALGPYCQIVKYLLDGISPQLVLDRHENNILDALSPGVPDAFQNLALAQLLRMAKDAQVCRQLAVNESILGKLIDRLSINLISPHATDVLLEITRQVPSSVKTLFSGELLKKFEAVQNRDMICKIRVFEIYCQVAMQSAENTTVLKPQLQSIIECYRNEGKDVLAKCNFLLLFTLLVSSKNTLPFIRDCGIIPNLKDLLSDPSDKSALHYMPGVIEFFGKFGENHPEELCDNYTDCVKMLIQLSGNVKYQSPAISHLGLIGKSHQGKRCMIRKLNHDMTVLMKNIGKLLEERLTPFTLEVALITLGHLMEVEASGRASSNFDVEHRDLMPITLQWFSMVGEKPFQILWACAKHIDEPIRIVAYKVLRNIALLPWGRDALLEECPGFYEWILARDPDADKEELEAKFSVVAALNEQSARIKDPEKRAALRTHVNDGPFYSSAEERLYYEG